VGLFALEHSNAAYRADFVLYSAAVVALAVFLPVAGPRELRPDMAALAVTGLAGWTAIEYLLHRFILHGLRPFSRWHTEHHQRPTALICAPTILSATVIFTLVFLPALKLGYPWRACALTLGVLSGYLTFSITHHATHHWRPGNAWSKGRHRWHALHHHARQPGFYGVTTAFWDHVFRSANQTAAAAGSPRSAVRRAPSAD
jgi:hypothetical protein